MHTLLILSRFARDYQTLVESAHLPGLTIGAALAATAKHFGMRVKGYTRASEVSADVDEYFHGELTDCAVTFASDLDYLVSVMPATAATRHIVGDAVLRALPPRAVFVNPG